MTFQHESKLDEVFIAAGTIDDDSVKGQLPKPSEYIFLKEKALWFDVPNDGLLRHDAFA